VWFKRIVFFWGTKFVIFWFKNVNSINFSNYLEKFPNFYIIKLGGREIDSRIFELNFLFFIVEEGHFQFHTIYPLPQHLCSSVPSPLFWFHKSNNFFVRKWHFTLNLHVILSVMSKTISQIEKTHHQKNHNFTYNLKSTIIGLQNMQYVVMKLHK
jgi:hypothetical protein